MMHPLLYTSLQCGFFNGLGSFLAQVFFIGGISNLDIKNLVTMATFGSFIFAPIAYVWYPFLEEQFPKESSNMFDIALKVCLDQTIASIIVLILLNFHVTLINTNGNINEAVANCTHNLWKSLRVGWCWWIPVQAINLALIPNEYAVLWMNLASIPWTMFISYITFQTSKNENENENDANTKKTK